MVGRATNDGSSWPAETYQYTQSGELEDISETSLELDHVDVADGDMGLAMAFAASFRAANPDTQIVFIPRAKGATGFGEGHWVVDGAQYSELVDDTNAFFSEYPDATLGGILWHQGERDASTEAWANAYETNLDAMIAGMRTDITKAGATTPFIVGDLVPDLTYAYKAAVIAALQSIQERLTYVECVDTDDLTDGGDDLHFNAASLNILGGRYYAALSTVNSELVVPSAVTPSVTMFDHGEDSDGGETSTFYVEVDSGTAFVAVTARQPLIVPTSVTLDAASMTLVGQQEYASEGQFTTYWRLDGVVASESAELIVTHTGADVGRTGVTVWSVSDAGDDTFYGLAQGSAATMSDTIAVAANSLVLGHGTYVSLPVGSSSQTLTGVTERLALTEVSANYNHNAGDAQVTEADAAYAIGKTGDAAARNLVAFLVIEAA